MATITAPSDILPQCILDLRAKLASSDHIERTDAMAELVGLPCFKDIPRPGASVSWDFDEWLNWGKDWQFSRDDNTAPSRVIRHDIYTNLHMSFTHQVHDMRVLMNVTGQFRREVVGTLESLATLAVRTIDGYIRRDAGLPALPSDPFTALEWLSKSFKSPKSIELIGNKPTSPTPTPADTAAFDALPGLFKILDKELGMSVRQAMNAIDLSEVAEAFVIHLRSTTHQIKAPPPRSALIASALKQLLEERRALVKGEAEKKQAERQALREQKQKARDPGSEEKFKAQIVKTRAEFQGRLTAQHAQTQSLLQSIQRQIEGVAAITFPDFPGAPTELLEQNSHLLSERDSLEMERDALRERTASDAKVIAKLEADNIAAMRLVDDSRSTDPVRAAAKDLAECILNNLTASDLGKLVTAIQESRAKATTLKNLLTSA